MSGWSAPVEESAKLGTVELFAGLGCVSTGFAKTGRFEPLLLTDIDGVARDTYRENFPQGATYLCEDIRSLTPRRIVDEVDGRRVSGLLGCPPCQGFSSAGKRDLADPNNELLHNFFTLARRLDVQFFVMENVPAVLNQPLFERQLESTRKRYRIWKGVLNAALYGLPQTRQRCIVIGYHRDLGVMPSPPPPTHFGERTVFDYRTGKHRVPESAIAEELLGRYPQIGLSRRRRRTGWNLPEDPSQLADLVTVGDAIDDLPPSPCADGAVSNRAMSSYAMALASSGHEAFNHGGWAHRDGMVERMRAVPEGGVPAEGGWAARNRRYYSQAYGRLHRRGLARTVTTNFHNPGSGRFTHYRVPRTLTVREAARLQGIDDSFRFIKYASWQERLIGNAFPPLWAEQIAAHVHGQIETQHLS